MNTHSARAESVDCKELYLVGSVSSGINPEMMEHKVRNFQAKNKKVAHEAYIPLLMQVDSLLLL